ncbi:MAG: hypothetical protein MJ223_02700 [Mycoplasmoidaceae bacterium]|nr:hypothetical protein [Mycoplasmoidaceae bacterium]
MLLSYTSKLNGETYQIRLCDKQWGISQPLAESNLKVIKKIVADKPDLNQLKSIDFKLYQLIKQYKLAQEFINKYLNHTKLTKQMLCLIYLKYV